MKDLSHITAGQIERYHDGTLPASELLAVSDHVADCAHCREQLAAALPADGGLSVLIDAPGHLSADVIDRYLKNELDESDRRAAQEHIESCLYCAAAIRNLEDFAAESANCPPARYGPVATPGVWEKLLAWWQSASAWRPLAMAGAAAVLLVCIGIIGQIVSSEIGTASLAINDGKEIIAPDNPNLLPEIKKALATETVQPSPKVSEALGILFANVPNVRGDTEVQLISPVVTFVESDRPTFRWKETAGATTYKLLVRDAGAERVIRTEVTASDGNPSFTLPPSDPPLIRGGVYWWNVSVAGSDDQSGDAVFEVLDQQRADEIRKKAAEYTGNHLALGVLYTDAGLLDDADEEFRELVAANQQSPGAKIIAKKLMESCRALRTQR